jgi:hypothetical protein
MQNDSVASAVWARCALLNDRSVRRGLLQACSADPVLWMDSFVFIEQPPQEGRQAVIPLKLWDFQKEGVRAALGVGASGIRKPDGSLWPIIHDKSRETGATWVYCACAVWGLLFMKGSAWGLMSRSGTEVDGPTYESLMGKVRTILHWLPRWMKPKGGLIEKKMPVPSISCPAMGSSIVASRTVEDAFRGGRKTRILVDEAASVPKLDAVIRAIQDAAPPILLSTPKGRASTFAKVVHGDYGDICHVGDGKRRGWLHLRWHYSMRPDRDPSTEEGAAWREGAKATRSEEAWAQEQEIDYDISAPGRIWPELDRNRHLLSREQWEAVVPTLGHAHMVEGWDFGYTTSLTYVCWIAYLEATDTVYVLGGCGFRGATYRQVAMRYRGDLQGSNCRLTLGRPVARRVGDVSGTAKDSSGRSWIMNLREQGIDVEACQIKHGEGLREKMRVALADGRILFAPPAATSPDRGCPSIIESCAQYRRNLATNQPEKDDYSHGADALQFCLYHIWGGSDMRALTQ